MTLLHETLSSVDARPRAADAPIIDEGHQPTSRELIATYRAAHLPQIPTVEASDHLEILAECEERWQQAMADVTVAADKEIRSIRPDRRHLLTNADKRTVQLISLDDVAPIPNVYGLPTEWTYGSFVELGQLINAQPHLIDQFDPRLSNMLNMAADVWFDDDRRPVAHASLSYFPPILVPVHEYFAATQSDDLGIANRYAAKGIKWIALDGNARLTTFAASGESIVPAITAVDRTMAAASARDYENEFLQAQMPAAPAQNAGVDISFADSRHAHLQQVAAHAVREASSWSSVAPATMAGLQLDDRMLAWVAQYGTASSLATLVAWEESDPGFLSDGVWSALAKRDSNDERVTTPSIAIDARIRAAQNRRGPLL